MPHRFQSKVFFAGVLLVVALARQYLPGKGLYIVAALAGLTDVDAISLSSFRLFGDGRVTAAGAVMAIVVALCSNAMVKASIVFVVGGRSLGMRCVAGFGAMVAALLAVALVMLA